MAFLARPRGVQSHPPFDPMQPASKPVFQNIAPTAARAIGPVAGLEARLDRRDELGVLDLADAARAVEPGMEAGTRDPSTSHSQVTGQMRRCLPPLGSMRLPGNGGRRTSCRRAREQSGRLLEDVTLRPGPGDLFLAH